MASLTLTGGKGSFTWTISGLSNWFATNQYISAGVTTKEFSGGVTSISGVVDRVYATANGTSFSVSHTVSYSSGEYIFYGFAQGSDGTYWPTGSSSVTISAVANQWNWNANEQRKQAFAFLRGESNTGFPASVWNDFVRQMDTAYTRYFEGDTWFDRVRRCPCSKSECIMSPGDSLSADVFNSVRMQVDYNLSTGLDNFAPGDVIKGSYILALTDAFNEGVSTWD